MEKTNFSPSVNIIRDENKLLDYILTPNAEKIAAHISNDFKKGFHSFSIIGSYGTGKSAFLWALQQSLRKQKEYFKLNIVPNDSKIKIINLVGESQSLTSFFADYFDVIKYGTGHQQILDVIYQEYEKHDLLMIFIDEFGKFLEFASKNNPETELYFVQQLAEFVNDPQRNILLITTLHQSFESYSTSLANENQKNEWRKVKGRFKELTFNEPVEQLLLLAAEKFSSKIPKDSVPRRRIEPLYKLIKNHYLFQVNEEFETNIGNKLFPLEPIAAFVLTYALQQYGQNERSLFSFLESGNFIEEDLFHLPKIYDYLISQYYSQINSSTFNQSFRQWRAIQDSLEKVEDLVEKDKSIAIALVKIVGLLQLYARKSAQINLNFLEEYINNTLGKYKIKSIVDDLSTKKILLFAKYNQSFKIAEGTDLDFDSALIDAGRDIDNVIDVVPLLKEHFDFPVITAKAISYKTGTPRLFEFLISEQPEHQIPKGAVDGYINLIFNEKLDINDIKEASSKEEEAILYGYFTDAKIIKNTLFDIQKTKKVIADNFEDIVARKELEIIKKSQEQLISHYVLDSLFSEKVQWVFNGKVQNGIRNNRTFNSLLSKICEDIYPETPVFKNELLNKHKISSSIHTARKYYFEALTEHWSEEGLGFSAEKFPAEKTIFISLLRENGIHINNGNTFELVQPNNKNGFDLIWNQCEEFIKDCQRETLPVSELIERLSNKPYKLKLGLIDFWVPTFLFIKRGDFALYREGKFIPAINRSILYEITRNPKDYSVKAFEISGIRLKLFNKYREFLKQQGKEKLTNEAFIETIRPFLTFYRDLPEYAKNTKKLSSEALALRDAIVKAQDPEKTFFEIFPNALKVSVEELTDSDEALSSFAKILNEAIQEIKDAYNQLLGRIEIFIQKEVVAKPIEFQLYKNQLQKRYKGIKEHKLLKQQKVFLQRLNSPIDDRDSWIASVTQAILQKPLEQISDGEEDILKDKLLFLLRELDNLREISKIDTKEEDIFKLEVTSFSEGLKSRNISIPKGKEEEVEKMASEIQLLLKKDEKLALAIIAKVLQKNLK